MKLRKLLTTKYKLRFTLLLLLSLSFVVRGAQRCVEDMSSRSVCLTTLQPRIISLSPGSTELLFAAGAGGQVIATDLYSNYPEAVQKLPKVGGYPNINVEAIIGLKPDLVVIWSGGDSPKVVKQLESVGITTFHQNAVNFADIARAIKSLGDIAGTPQAAKKTVDAFLTRLNTLRGKYSHLSSISVLFELWHNPLMAAGNNLVINDVITLCGGKNIYNDVNAPTASIGIESVISRNPEVIIGAGSVEKMQSFWGQWQKLQAVERQRLITVPGDLIARPTPRVLDGAEIICKQLQAVRRARKPS